MTQTEKTYDVATDEISQRELSVAEIAERQELGKVRRDALVKRSAALTKLADLGLDEDDLKALGL